MAKKAINAQTSEGFKLDPKFVFIAGEDIPQEECAELGILDLVDSVSNSQGLSTQRESFVSSLAKHGNHQKGLVRKVAVPEGSPWSYVATNRKTGEKTVENYAVVAVTGRCRVRGLRKANAEILGAESPTELDYKMFQADVQSRYVTAEDTMSIVAGENFFRKETTPMDVARLMAQYITQGLDVSHIAKEFGESVTSVYNTLKLNDLAPDLQQKVDRGELPKTAAVKLAKEIESHEEQREVVAASTQSSGKIKGKDLEQNVEAKKQGRKPRKAQKTPKKAEILEMVEALQGICPEAATALHWVCTGEREGIDALLLEALSGPQESSEERAAPEDMPPAVMAL